MFNRLPTLFRAAAFVRPSVTPFAAIRSYGGAPAPLDVQQIETRVMELMRNFDKVNKEKLALDSHFVNDLGLDSLDQVEITMELEDEFNIEIPDKEAEKIFTVRQAVEAIYANKNAI